MLDTITKEEPIKKQKYIYLEVMRIIAIFFVIFNHTKNVGFLLFLQEPIGSLRFWIYLFISVFCKLSVPLFFAISGAIMLGKKDEPIKDIGKKRILKFFIILIIFSFIYYLDSIKIDFNNFNIGDFFERLYTDETLGANLWYLYAYIVYLISLSFLRSLVKNLENKHYYYMIGIALFFQAILPIVEYLLWQGRITLNSNIQQMWLLSNIVIYPCIGYFLQNKLEIKNPKRTLLILWGTNIIGIIISSLMTYYKIKVLGAITEMEAESFLSSFVLINCICIFVTIKYIFENVKINKYIERIIFSVGSCTFGIYLIHMVIKAQDFTINILISLRNCGINKMIVALILSLFIMFVSYIITLILKKIPILKKLVGV